MLATGAAVVAGCLFESSSNRGGTGGDPEESTFSKSYGGPQFDTATAVVARGDGGFLLVGQAGATNPLGSQSTGGWHGDLWIGQLDANGNIESQHLLGELPLRVDGAVRFVRARPTDDGGTILVGFRSYAANGDDAVERPDIAVAKLGADGAIEWSRAHDSGDWVNYDYFETSTEAATAADFGTDVWPLPDGGYLVAGYSTANVEDRLGIGFPCPLLGDDEAGANPCATFPPGRPGNRFADAVSIVALRVDADGEVRWRHRMTDEAFRLESGELHDSGSSLAPLVRPAADGGALVVHTLRYKLVIRRLLDGGSPLPPAVFTRQLTPVDALQTDDPDANGERDGLKDDGFLVLGDLSYGDAHVIKVRSNGAIEWDRQIGGTDIFTTGPDARIRDIHQRCNAGGRDCVFVAAGDYREHDEPVARAYLRFLDGDGGTIREVFGGRGTRFERIQGGEDGSRYRLIAFNDLRQSVFMELVADGTELEDGGPTPGLPPQVDPSRRDHLFDGELTGDGGALFYSAATDVRRLLRVDVRGSVADDRDLSWEAGRDGESASAAVEVAPGRFVIAVETSGSQTRARMDSWILRYDAGAGGGGIAWQRRLVANGDIGHVQALAAAADGGVVAGTRHGDELRLAKIDSDARLIWQTPSLPTPAAVTLRWREVHATADGGFAALASAEPSPHSLLVRLDAAGNVTSQHLYDYGFTSLAAAEGDGFMLAGPGVGAGSLVTVIRVDGAGAPQWGRAIGLGGDFATSANAPRIRRSANGFVVATAEHGSLVRIDVPETGSGVHPVGDDNVMLMELDPSGHPRWMRVYGALYAEDLRDLAVRDDGVIIAAGSSDSLGERRDAWLLKLGPDGRVAAGCNGHLADVPRHQIEVATFEVANRTFDVANAPDAATQLLPHGLELRPTSATDTARQCLGSAGDPEHPPPAANFRLAVARTGAQPGTVISTPAGIACGTALGDAFCSAEFAAGTRIVLRADPQNFRRWVDPCEEGSGGTALECAVTLIGHRTQRVQFGDPTPDEPRLLVALAGAGSGLVTGAGITCPDDCEETFALGTRLTLRATAQPGSRFEGWSGDCESTGDLACVVAMEGARTVTATFQPASP